MMSAALAQTPPTRSAPPIVVMPSGPPMSLEELQRLALQNNPTIAQAQAAVDAARGRARQAALLPNPTIGYSADEVSKGPVIRGGEHGLFIEQTIPLGGKLGRGRTVFEREADQADAERASQEARVRTSVVMAFYHVLAAQQRVQTRERLTQLAIEAIDVTDQLFNVGAADQPDVLAAEIEARRIQLSLVEARNQYSSRWRMLGAMVGQPGMPERPLAGSLTAAPPELQRDATLRQLLETSPQLRAAAAGVARAEAAIAFAKRETFPDLVLRGGPRYNRELLELNNRPVGWEYAFDAGLTVPLFNRNQGTKAAAVADLARARAEQRRLELALTSRAADLFDGYLTALRESEVYRTELLPRAERAYQLYLARYREMGAAYPQVLVAQRTVIELTDQYIAALERVWATALEIQGLQLTNGLDAPSRPGEPAMMTIPSSAARGGGRQH
jgi:cobalt-zinc-cadmium efflux system outer membrane protein